MSTGEPRVRKSLRLSQAKLDRARRLLGTSTEAATVEQALDRVLFHHDAIAGVRRMAGSRSLRDVFGEDHVE